MRSHGDYSRVPEAIPSPRTWACIAYILGELGGDRIISTDEAELRDAVELHPGADRDLLRDYFTYRNPPPDRREAPGPPC